MCFLIEVVAVLLAGLCVHASAVGHGRRRRMAMSRLAGRHSAERLHLSLRVVVDETGVGGQILGRRRRDGDGDGVAVLAAGHVGCVVWCWKSGLICCLEVGKSRQ